MVIYQDKLAQKDFSPGIFNPGTFIYHVRLTDDVMSEIRTLAEKRIFDGHIRSIFLQAMEFQ